MLLPMLFKFPTELIMQLTHQKISLTFMQIPQILILVN